MTRKRNRITDEQLEDLTRAVGRLITVATDDIDALRAEVQAQSKFIESQAAVLEDLLNVTAPGLAGDAAQSITVEDVFVDEAEQETEAALSRAWDITGSGASVFSAGGTDADDVLRKLLQALVDADLTNPAVLDIHIGYSGVEPGFESEGGFDGLLTVGF